MMIAKNYQTYLEEARSLRAACFHAEFEFLAFLAEFEDSKTWQDAGYNTFAMLLRTEKLTRPERLAEFNAAREKADDETLKLIGIESALQLNKIPSKKDRASYIEEAKLRVEQDGFPWTHEQAERVRMRIVPDAPKPLTRIGHRSKLEVALEEAQERIVELETEVATLQAQLETLKKRKLA